MGFRRIPDNSTTSIAERQQENVIFVLAIFSPCLFMVGLYILFQLLMCCAVVCDCLIDFTKWLVFKLSKGAKYTKILCYHFCHVYYSNSGRADMSFLIITEALETIGRVGISTDIQRREANSNAVVPVQLNLV